MEVVSEMRSVVGEFDTPQSSRILIGEIYLPLERLVAYYGPDVAIPPEEVQDPAGLREPGQGRDPQRTPMQWGAGAGGGFSTGRPWLPLAPDHRRRNVERLEKDPRSLLSLHRRLLALRRLVPALHAGTIESVKASGDCLSFERVQGASRLRVELNFGDAPADPPDDREGQVMFSTAGYGPFPLSAPAEPVVDCGRDGTAGSQPRQLLPLEGRILRIPPELQR